MGDLIDRQEAIDVVRKWFALIGLNGDICIDGIASLPAAEPDVVRCGECKHNPKRSWLGCPMAGLSERQRPETAWR